MKLPVFAAALCAAVFPLTVTAGPAMGAAGRPSTLVGNSHPGAPYTWGAGGVAGLDQQLETWMYPLLENLIRDVSAGRRVAASNGFVSLKSTLRQRPGVRYQDAWRRVVQAEDLVRQGYLPSAASNMQLLLNELRASAARARRTGWGSPGTYPTPGVGVGVVPGGGWGQAGLVAPSLEFELQDAVTALRYRDLPQARRALRRAIQAQRDQLGYRGAPGARGSLRRLRFVARALRPGSEAWAIQQLRLAGRELGVRV